jgi:hypothetical protein
MLEAATTSFQLHLQMPASSATAYYNAMLALSGPVLAACGNSPFLFGRQLWEETRIPLFEQSVVPASTDAQGTRPARVTFGSGYASKSLLEVFEENRDRYVVLLPMVSKDHQDTLPHLRLHNGTIWRWNRPLIGFEADGRTLPSGPTFVDAFANTAMFIGASHALVLEADELPVEFVDCRKNFYAAARDGLAAAQIWGRRSWVARDLLQQQLIPRARQGLAALGIDASEREQLLHVFAERVRSGQTGAEWQRQYLACVQGDAAAMTARYVEHQRTGRPVHEWECL